MAIPIVVLVVGPEGYLSARIELYARGSLSEKYRLLTHICARCQGTPVAASGGLVGESTGGGGQRWTLGHQCERPGVPRGYLRLSVVRETQRLTRFIAFVKKLHRDPGL